MWVVWSVALAAYIGRRDAPDVVRRGGAGRRPALPRRRPRRSPVSSCCSCWSTRRCRCPSACCSTGSAGASLVVVGALTMAAGQLVLALATTLPLAVTARVLIGAGRRADVHQRPLGRHGLVPAAAGAGDDAAHRPRRAAGAGAVGGAARGAAARPRLDDRVPLRGGARGVRRARGARGGARPAARRPAAASGRVAARGAARAADVVARAGDPARALDAHGHPVLRHRVRPALGRAVPGGGAGNERTGRRAPCSRCSWWSGSWRARCSASSPRRHPMRRSLAGADRDRRPRAGVGARCCSSRRPRRGGCSSCS